MRSLGAAEATVGSHEGLRRPSRLLLLWLFCAGAAILFASSSASAATVSSQISAKWSSRAELNWGGGGPSIYEVSVSWDESFNGTYWSLSSLDGTVTQSGTEPFPPNPEYAPCTGALTEAPGAAAAFLAGQVPGSGGTPAPVVTQLGDGKWTVLLVEPIVRSLLQSSGPTPSHCETGSIGVGYDGFVELAALRYSAWGAAGATGYFFTEGAGGPTCKQTTAYGNVVEFPPESSSTQPDDCSASGEFVGGFGPVKWTASLDATVTLVPGIVSFTPVGPTSPTGPTGPPGKQPPITCPAGAKPTCHYKQDAQNDLRKTLQEMSAQCPIAAIGLAGLLAGVIAPETGAGSVLTAAGPTGAMILAGSGTTCALLIKRAYDDAKIVEDPPVGGLNSLARPVAAHGPAVRLPSCKHYAGVKRYCDALGADELRYVGSIRQSQAIDAALLTTVDRMTAADAAHKANALRSQKDHAGALQSQLDAALADEARAGKAIARLIEAHKLRVQLSLAQSQQGLADARAQLGKLGVPANHAEELAGVTLNAAPLNYLQALAGA